MARSKAESLYFSNKIEFWTLMTIPHQQTCSMTLDRDIEHENRTIFQQLSTWLDSMKIWANFWAIFAKMTQKLGSSKSDVLWLDRELRVYILRIQ